MAVINLREEILARLSQPGVSPPEVISELRESYGGDLHCNSILLQTLCDVHLEENEARKELDHALVHKKLLEQQLQRAVDLRTALLDYFTAQNVLLHSPMIIETSTYTGKLRYATVDELTGLHNR